MNQSARSKSLPIGLIVLLLVSLSFWLLWSSLRGAEVVDPNALGYEALQPERVQIERLFRDLGPITRLKISPSGDLLLAGILTGDVLAFTRVADQWVRQAEPLLTLETAFPGFPPDENGLSGIAFGVDFATSGDVFFTYASKGEEITNHVARATLESRDGQFVATDLTDIFSANVPTNSSHQIQAIEGVMIDNEPHVVFLIGEGFQAQRALDVTLEAGKLMLMRRDGSDPAGLRPYPGQSKIQAIGIRNAPDLAINPFDSVGRLAIVDTGPDSFDRFIYGKFLASDGGIVRPVDLGWDGTPESLALDRDDPNVTGKPNTILYRWNPTQTATNIVFHPGKGLIPASTSETASVLVSLFGRTGETGADKPGREILLGRLTIATEPAITWEPFIRRSKTGVDQVGHPLALERDPRTNDLYFADIIEGAIYHARIKE